MPQDLHIGEVAARTGRSVHTIRWYERQGLIPGVCRDGGGRRVYSDYHVGWLDLMERLRSTGMSIGEMRKYTTLAQQGPAALSQRHALLREHQARVRQIIRRWTQALALIGAKIEFYDEWMASGERPVVPPHHRLKSRASRRRF
ncbi:MerR family transcriptional regulator [Bradyrhizobium sp. ARR65]|uniref:MerR family transcriptional regulator n=1 Tax=Bradyrhizobium sp. ARR65 TaxID=1040989 RepID=UPI0004650E17|nr:MerR family transcriptional regulator [Bradyrhizobium sp. ARR65]